MRTVQADNYLFIALMYYVLFWKTKQSFPNKVKMENLDLQMFKDFYKNHSRKDILDIQEITLALPNNLVH